VEDALVTLVVVVVAIGGMVALYTLATSGHAYREIGKGGLDTPARADEPAAPAPPDDRDEEIRELLEARNARRRRRGEPPLDIEAQLATLTSGGSSELRGAGDRATAAELRDELRALIEARNRRRAGAGLPALDVDAEVERRLRELT
jgi:uncharacterized protein YkwD